MNRRWRNLNTRVRQRRFDPPWRTVPTAPTAAVTFRDSRSRWAPALRRGRIHARPWFAPPSAQQLPPRFAHQANRPAALGVRRGEFFVLPLATSIPPPPPTWTPEWLTAQRRVAPIARRGDFLATPVAPMVAPRVRRSRQTPRLLLRAGEFQPVPREVAGPGPLAPSLQRQTRRPSLPSRRGRFSAPPWPQVTIVPTVWPITAGTPVVKDAYTAGLPTVKVAYTAGTPAVKGAYTSGAPVVR